MLKALIRRLRGFMQAEVLAEIASLRAEVRQCSTSIETALLTMALHREDAPEGERLER